MRINHNITAMNTQRQLTGNTAAQSKSIEKLSSGLRINRAGDDAAGLAISEKMRGQIRGLDMAAKNSQDGISLIQTAEGALNETHSILQRMRELAVQAASDTNTSDDRGQLQKEINQLTDEIDRIANTTEFNNKKLLNGDLSSAQTAQNAVALGKSELGGDAASLATKVSAVTGNFTDGKVGTHAMAISVGTAGFTESAGTFKSNQKLSDLGVTDASDMTIAIDGNAPVAITGLTTSSTIQDVIDAINTKGAGAVTASLTEEGKLSVVSNTVSAASAVVFADATGSNINAQLFGGATVQAGSATNLTVTDVFTAQDGTVSAAKTYRLTSAAAADAVLGNGVTLKNDGTNPFVAGTVTVKSLAAANAVAAKADTSATFQIGANEGQEIKVDVGKVDAQSLNIKIGATYQDVTTQRTAKTAITVFDNALKAVSNERSKLGAFQNRLEHTINNLNTSSENLSAAESRIRDVDMAKEMMEQTKNSILAQASQAMLASANQQPQGVLQLLR